MGPFYNGAFLESGSDIINLFHQQDCNSDVTGDWVKLRDYQRVSILIVKGGSEDIDTLGFQVLQAKDSTGASSKALNVSRVWYKQGTLTSQTVWTQAAAFTANSIIGFGSAAPSGGVLVNTVDVDTSPLLAVIDIQASELDVEPSDSNPFGWFTLKGIGAEVDNACLVSAWAILHGGRFPQAVPLSAIS